MLAKQFFYVIFFFVNRYGLDVIGTVAFGLDVNCIDDPEHSFRQIEKCVNNGDLINTVRSIGSFLCPE